MGNGVYRLLGGCYNGGYGPGGVLGGGGGGVDDLGVTFCYVRPTLDSSSSNLWGDRSNSNSSSLNPDFSEAGSSSQDTGVLLEDHHHYHHHHQVLLHGNGSGDFSFSGGGSNISETSFKSISGASVSANTSTSRSITSLERFTIFANGPNDRTAAFESTPSFTALPLQPIPRGIAFSGPITGSASHSGPLEATGYHRGCVSGPLERGAAVRGGFVSGPLERGSTSGPLEDRMYSSGPLEQFYASSGGGGGGGPRRRRKTLVEFVKDASMPMRRALSSITRGSRKRGTEAEHESEVVVSESEMDGTRYNLQWAQGKAGEDRVHIVLSEEHGWMFVGIYDGFNGPDAPDFLMTALYPAIYKELEGLLWDHKEAFGVGSESDGKLLEDPRARVAAPPAKARKKKRDNYRKLFQWRHEAAAAARARAQRSDSGEEPEVDSRRPRRGPVDHSGVLGALARALAATERAYIEMTERAVVDNPELAVVGSCLLVMLMKDEDVYVMNVGDSRAVLAQDTTTSTTTSASKGVPGKTNGSTDGDQHERIGARDSMLRMELERIIEETPTELAALEAPPYDVGELAPPPRSPSLEALQLSSDHSTSVEEEVMKIRMDHPDDDASIVNDRVKGRLKVTRAFGAGFLKHPKLNDALLEMFRIDFVGDAPYITCKPSLKHHRLGPRDQFLVLSSDGLYQYLTNEEVVAHVEWFLEKFPDADPAQYLIEELLLRAARKAGMDFHDLLDIPQGDRRRYHDDVSLLVISLEGRIWRFSS